MSQIFKNGALPAGQLRPLTITCAGAGESAASEAGNDEPVQSNTLTESQAESADSEGAPPELTATTDLAEWQRQLDEARAAIVQAGAIAYERGLAEGKKMAEETLQARLEAELEPLRRQFAQTLDELARLRDQLFHQYETELLRLALAIARKIVQREVAVDREIVLAIAKVALSRLSDHTAARIHVHPFDYQYLVNNKSAFLTGKQGAIDIIEDRSITRGGCLIETDVGEVDARIEEQFKEIDAGFFE